MKFFSYLALIYILPINNVYAYLDPGTGNILTQIIAAVGATIVIYVGLIWHKLKFFFSKIKNFYVKKSNDKKKD